YARQVHGIDMGYINYLDAEAAWEAVRTLRPHAVSIVKHANTCGLAVHEDQAEAYRRAFSGDPVSAYGGIAGFNTTVTEATADAMRGLLLDVIVAPGYEPAALDILRRRERCRVLEVTAGATPTLTLHVLSGGAIVQTPDLIEEDPATWKAVTKRAPTPEELADLEFAWRAARLIKSNAIVLVKDRTLVGMGAGQPNRVTSVHLALRAAGEKAKGTVLGSDAFFPFADGIELAASGGVTAVAQPGGSIRDDDVIAAADRLGVAMVFTGIRHFYH
ncbi:MAG: bifunctional phosphoribosylaminoimidazolecarboxamide formyltransferase/IMP cyclohydrolase, partial [Gemmatimonadetes bacterium]|nr:bifunctional phosphoribosylaminoimidazolecarboxamide formyltransferase/IMP cyclohydrolase [Gemmatimonadota bacterium]